MIIDGVTAIAVIVIAAFAVERTARGAIFALSFIPGFTRLFPEPALAEDARARVRAAKRQQLLYFVLAALLGIGVLAYWGEVRIFRAVGFEAMPPVLDAVVTGLILVAGSDWIAALTRLEGGRAAEPVEPRPIEVSGRLVIEDGAGTSTVRAPSAARAPSEGPGNASRRPPQAT